MLHLTIEDLVHALDEQARIILFKQMIPIIAPDHLDNIPACTPESCFQLLNDFAIAAHWAVQALQVAVDDKDQVVELLP